MAPSKFFPLSHHPHVSFFFVSYFVLLARSVYRLNCFWFDSDENTDCSDQVAGQDHSLISEDLCTFHLQCQADNPSQIPHLLSPTSAQEGARLSRSTGSESHRNNQRSITLIAELTEELESLRREIKLELKLKHDEINRLKSLIDYRDDEIRQLMARLEHFMGLDGFYVRSPYAEEDQTGRTEPSSQTLNNPMGDLVSFYLSMYSPR
jgi:hypothetical protein